MAVAVRVLTGAYHDSVKLMRISAAACERPGVRQAVVLMGTPMNLEQLASIGLLSEEAQRAGPNDLVLAVEAEGAEAAQEELAVMEAALSAPRAGTGAGLFAKLSAPTLDAALCKDPLINLALFSIPGPSVRREAERALSKGLHCLIFSDNVPVEDEVALKRIGREKGLLVMGPDCGTAYIGGVGLGFCNVMRPGKIGIAGAAGTGIQEAMAAIDAARGGISCALGTGGRDVSDAVGGLAMVQAVETLSEDTATEVLLVLGKPPEAAAMKKVLEAAGRCTKPVVIHFVGAQAEDIPRHSGEHLEDPEGLGAGETVKHRLVVPHVEAGVEMDLVADVAQLLDGGGGHRHLEAHAPADPDLDPVGPRGLQDAPDAGYQFGASAGPASAVVDFTA